MSETGLGHSGARVHRRNGGRESVGEEEIRDGGDLVVGHERGGVPDPREIDQLRAKLAE